MRRLSILLCLLLATAAPLRAEVIDASSQIPLPPADAQETENFLQKVLTLFQQEKFDELENFAKEIRDRKKQLPSSEWEQGLFYGGIRRAHGSDEQNEAVVAGIKRWLEVYPQSVAAHVALADAYSQISWTHRGGGYVNVVTRHGFTNFEAYMEKAWEVLKKAEQLEQKDAFLYAIAISVGLALDISQEEMRDVLQRGTELQPTLYPLYTRMVQNLLPRWGGLPGELEKFADWAVMQTERELGQQLYTRIAEKIVYYVGDEEFLRDYDFPWLRIKQGYEDLRKQSPNSSHVVNYYAWFACKFHDRETARLLFPEIENRWKGTVIDAIWNNDQNFQYWKNWAESEDVASDFSVIQQAIHDGNLEEVKKLLGQGMDIHVADAQGKTPLHFAAEFGKEEILNFLISSGANIHQWDKGQAEPIHYAAKGGSIPVFTALLQAGASVNAVDVKYRTPLHYAAEEGQLELVKFLLQQKDVDINVRDDFYITPLHVAATKGYLDIVKLLLDRYEIKVDAKNSEQETPLHCAAREGRPESLQLLLEHGAAVNVRNEKKSTPLKLALERDHRECVLLLREKGGVE